MRSYVIQLSNLKKYYWRLIAPNGEIVSHSEQYASKWNAKRAAKKLSKLTGFPLEDHTD